VPAYDAGVPIEVTLLHSAVDCTANGVPFRTTTARDSAEESVRIEDELQVRVFLGVDTMWSPNNRHGEVRHVLRTIPCRFVPLRRQRVDALIHRLLTDVLDVDLEAEELFGTLAPNRRTRRLTELNAPLRRHEGQVLQRTHEDEPVMVPLRILRNEEHPDSRTHTSFEEFLAKDVVCGVNVWVFQNNFSPNISPGQFQRSSTFMYTTRTVVCQKSLSTSL